MLITIAEAGVVGIAENRATHPSLAGAWAELGNTDNPGSEVGKV